MAKIKARDYCLCNCEFVSHGRHLLLHSKKLFFKFSTGFRLDYKLVLAVLVWERNEAYAYRTLDHVQGMLPFTMPSALLATLSQIFKQLLRVGRTFIKYQQADILYDWYYRTSVRTVICALGYTPFDRFSSNWV